MRRTFLELRGGLAIAFFLVTACGSSSSSAPAPIVLTIAGNTFSPANLSVPAGATVTVKNNDGTGHSVTSETTVGDYVAGPSGGATFDTGVIQGQGSFIIPSGATVGAVIPYFCTVHKSMMLNQGVITVIAANTGPGY